MATPTQWTHLVSAASSVESSVLRSYLQHHEIAVRVDGENSRSAFGFGSFVELRVMVRTEQLERARELYSEFEEGVEIQPDIEIEGPFRDNFSDENAEDYRPKKLGPAKGIIVLAALFFPFGGGHLVSGALVRGFFLAVVSFFSIRAGLGNPVFYGLWCVVIVTDILGAFRLAHWRHHRQSSTIDGKA